VAVSGCGRGCRRRPARGAGRWARTAGGHPSSGAVDVVEFGAKKTASSACECTSCIQGGGPVRRLGDACQAGGANWWRCGLPAREELESSPFGAIPPRARPPGRRRAPAGVIARGCCW
jgi:hypothetical protein